MELRLLVAVAVVTGIVLANLQREGEIAIAPSGAKLTPVLYDPRTTPSLRAQFTNANQCVQCHQADPVYSHPVNVVPSMAVPANLPLSGGRVTCLTCHDGLTGMDGDLAHGGLRNSLKSAWGGVDSRDPVLAAGFCGQCHDRSAGSARSAHAGALGKAHLRWIGRDIAPSAISRRRASRMNTPHDAESKACLACHDGVISGDVATDGLSMAQFEAGSGDHPVGVMYVPGVHESASGSSYTLRANLDPRLRLIDGQVGCNTCHSPFSTEDKLLVMSNQRSQLCLACHDQ